jgi:competence protein ComFC
MIVGWLLDLLYPKFCVECGRMGQYLCANCYEQLDFIGLPIYLELDQVYLDRTLACLKYQSPTSTLIQTLKYQSVKGIGVFCGRLLHHTFNVPAATSITAVPLHPHRQAQRGFNQAEVIAQELARTMKVPYCKLLRRTRSTRSQASRTRREDRLHLHSLFAVTSDFLKLQRQEPALLEKIIIVDDVITTGATLNECARVLKHSYPGQVMGIAVAHGS